MGPLWSPYGVHMESLIESWSSLGAPYWNPRGGPPMESPMEPPMESRWSPH